MNQHYSFCPDKAYLRELKRPWKLVTFSIAMSWLFYGALNYHIMDWDVGIVIIMGFLTYLLAPWSMYIFLSAIRYRPKYWYLHVVVTIVAALFVVDWVYMLYHTWMGNQTLRVANFYASMSIYILAGTGWLYRGSLKELIANVRETIK